MFIELVQNKSIQLRRSEISEIQNRVITFRPLQVVLGFQFPHPPVCEASVKSKTIHEVTRNKATGDIRVTHRRLVVLLRPQCREQWRTQGSPRGDKRCDETRY
jgi:hypothetical protein